MTNQPTLDELTERMQELCEKATPGPLTTKRFDESQVVVLQDGKLLLAICTGDNREDDSAFYAAARTYIPLVIEERERLHSALLACAKFLPLTPNAPDHHHVAGTGVPGLTVAMLLELHKQIDVAIQKGPANG